MHNIVILIVMSFILSCAHRVNVNSTTLVYAVIFAETYTADTMSVDIDDKTIVSRLVLNSSLISGYTDWFEIRLHGRQYYLLTSQRDDLLPLEFSAKDHVIGLTLNGKRTIYTLKEQEGQYFTVWDREDGIKVKQSKEPPEFE